LCELPVLDDAVSKKKSSSSTSSSSNPSLWSKFTGLFKPSTSAASAQQSSPREPVEEEKKEELPVAEEKPKEVVKTLVKGPTVNSISVAVGQLQSLDDKKIATGEPLRCSKCTAVFNSATSKLCKEVKDDNQSSLEWKCEFCRTKNNDIKIDKEELEQQTEFVDFMLEAPKKKGGKEGEEEEEEEITSDLDNKSAVIFCVDTSGSMVWNT